MIGAFLFGMVFAWILILHIHITILTKGRED